MIRRTLLRTAAFVLAAAALGASAQGFPSKPIIIVVPFAAGGPTDTIARIFGEHMGRTLHQPVVVENTVGAGGSIGVGRVVRAAPDGYTVGIGHVGTHVINGAVHQLPYDLLGDLEPVAMVASNPQILVSKMSVPAKDLKEFIAWVKANPNDASAGTGGAGTPAHVSGVYFGNVIGTPITIIHYKGSGPALQDVIGGHITMSFDQALNALPQIRGGRVKAYAVTSKSRLSAAPDIPTTDEAGLPGFYMSIWHGFWVPKGTPRAVIASLNTAMKEALADPAVRKKLEDLGQEIPSADQQSPEALRAHHKAEIEKWWPVIKQAGIKAE
jgi:tripartite-type tricarboxylate transporter receptor subunit TctC